MACTIVPTLLIVSALAGCGGGTIPLGGGPTTTAITATTALSPCPRAIATALGDRTGGVLQDRSAGVATCVYRSATSAGAPVLVRVVVDTAPQPLARFSRGVVERAQAHLGGDARELPREVAGVGADAAWAEAPRELTAADETRLVTVTVLSPAAGARTEAIAAARAALGG